MIQKLVSISILYQVLLTTGVNPELNGSGPEEIKEPLVQRDVAEVPIVSSQMDPPIVAMPPLVQTDIQEPSVQPIQEDLGVKNLRAFLRINTAHPTPEPGYEKAIDWLRKQADEIGLEFSILGLGETGIPQAFAVWMTWPGTDTSQKSILLNSHMDVADADTEKWTHPPFDAYKDDFGNIIARGALDMKATTIAELEAIRKLKKSGFKPLRSIHLLVTPDGELGGKRGVEPFLKTDQFKNLNVGIDIDEGFPIGSEDIIHVRMFGEKKLWRFNITVHGDSAHASTMPRYTAAQRLQVVIDKFNEFRTSEYRKLDLLSLEDITSLNLVKIGGGISDQIIPNVLWVAYDMRIRLRPGWNFTDVENMINHVCNLARLGNGTNSVTVDYSFQSFETGLTTADDTNIWWKELQKSCREMNVVCEPHIFVFGTDGRFFRSLGIPVLGVSVFPNTKNTAHQNNEAINEANFLRGIDRYVTIIRNFANVPGETKHIITNSTVVSIPTASSISSSSFASPFSIFTILKSTHFSLFCSYIGARIVLM